MSNLEDFYEDFYTFPVNKDKTPATHHGFKDAKKGWFGPQLAIATGKSGLVVIDVDDHSNQGTGVSNWKYLIDKYNFDWRTYTVQTPSGGFHVYYHSSENFSSGVLDEEIDVKAEGGYVLAPPTEGYTVVRDNAIKPLPVELKRLLNEEKQRSEERSEVIEGGIPEGTRDVTLTSLAGSMQRRGMSIEAISGALHKENNLRCNPPLAESQVDKIVKSVSKYQPTDPVLDEVVKEGEVAQTELEKLRSRIVSSKVLENTEAPEMNWIVENMLEAGGLFMLYGDSGIGKTFLAMDLAVSIANGGYWISKNCNSSKVLYLDGENGEAVIHQRTKIVGGSENLDYLSFSDLKILDGIFEELIKDYEVVFVDPLMFFSEGDENSIEDQRAGLYRLRDLSDKWGTTFVLVHHENKMGSYRGSTGFKNTCTLMLHMLELDKSFDQNFEHPTRLKVNKQRVATMQDFDFNWRVVNGQLMIQGLEALKISPMHRVIEAIDRMHTERGEWPGKDEIITGRNLHGLSQNEARKALTKAKSEGLVEVEIGRYNKHTYKTKSGELF